MGSPVQVCLMVGNDDCREELKRKIRGYQSFVVKHNAQKLFAQFNVVSPMPTISVISMIFVIPANSNWLS